ncbi:MAG: response regulator [Bacteroidales bacterium]|nr:response regulator [Bacteroidales bacterium]MBR0028845.1 response regulator [Bacteroidales bacterium]MBR0083892.1 response regulator [Bacteroidales bacterium]MBR0291240.1 response regulator [Bacteroidales bacterium]
MTDYSKITILAVDDVALNLLLVKKILQRYNFRIRTADSGVKALEEVAAEKPDLILLDILMPGIDGFEVLSRLKADWNTKDIPVIILSALNSNKDIVRAYEMGAKDYITKPIIMEKLINSVARNLGL